MYVYRNDCGHVCTSWFVAAYAKYCLSDGVKEDGMGGACGTYGGDKCIQAFGGKNSAKETTTYLGM